MKKKVHKMFMQFGNFKTIILTIWYFHSKNPYMLWKILCNKNDDVFKRNVQWFFKKRYRSIRSRKCMKELLNVIYMYIYIYVVSADVSLLIVYSRCPVMADITKRLFIEFVICTCWVSSLGNILCRCRTNLLIIYFPWLLVRGTQKLAMSINKNVRSDSHDIHYMIYS